MGKMKNLALDLQEQIEKEWYESQSTNVNWIKETYNRNIPEAWKLAANDFGQINSNYGHLIYANKYYNQGAD